MHADAPHLLQSVGPEPGLHHEERTRIAREVHSELGGLLVALKTDIDWPEKWSRLIENAADKVARIITEPRPSVLEHLGLWAALEWQAHEFERSAELELEWDMRTGGVPKLPESAAMAVYRIFQEMLSNVRRHAQASPISVRIAADEERLRITVEDNGNGASPDAFESTAACGVMRMRERARLLGGHIAIASEVGHGSAFTLVLPLHHE